LCCFLIFNISLVFGQNDLFISPETYNLRVYPTIEKAFSVPAGYKRTGVKQNSFAAYIRNLPVLKDSIDVLDFRKRIWKKSEDSTLAAVVPVNILGQRLWQCMDILIRFHIDYLFKNRSAWINYPLPDGTMLSWYEWKDGIRPVFRGMHFSKLLKAKKDDSHSNFNKYLNTIFEYSGTQSFWHYYPDIDLKDIQPADFIVKKGRNGHAVLIVDIAENQSGEKVALIGQGDTPACQFYLLKQSDGNPWFPIDPKSAAPALPIKKKMQWEGLRRFPNP